METNANVLRRDHATSCNPGVGRDETAHVQHAAKEADFLDGDRQPILALTCQSPVRQHPSNRQFKELLLGGLKNEI